MNAFTQAQTGALTASGKLKSGVAIVALLFGLGLVFVTGFANSPTLHNAAHDTRHTLAFPCH